MYLKSLSLKGFKSFADKTTMVYDPGLTVVVGPNGSGKSNISDAILWVLGEQSAKNLRGQAMEDVIFSGSSGRAAVGLAEVTLVLDNTDHTIPIDFSEVAITRRMYRSGESEYLINGSPARLRDITDILHDSGLGKDTHSIISQGKLDAILSSRPEERRELIEEAAGISKHRKRKERSARKMIAMQDNLTRAKDIQKEIERQLRPLERQVNKAQKQKKVKDQLREVTITLAVDDLRQLQGSYQELSAKQNEAQAAIELAQYRVQEKEHELEKYQSLLEQKGIFVGDLGEQRRRMQSVLGRLDSDMRLLEEKGKNMVSRVSDMRANLSSLQKTAKEAAEEHHRILAELDTVTIEASKLQERVDELEPQAKDATNARKSLGVLVSTLSQDVRAAQKTADEETIAFAKLRDQISNAQVEDGIFATRLAQIEETKATATAALEAATLQVEELTSKRDEVQQSQAALADNLTTANRELSEARTSEKALQQELLQKEAEVKALTRMVEQTQTTSKLGQVLSAQKDIKILAHLSDIIQIEPALEPLLEHYLGADINALVVQDETALTRLVSVAASHAKEGSATLVSCAAGTDVSEDAVTPDTQSAATADTQSAAASSAQNRIAIQAVLAKAGLSQAALNLYEAGTQPLVDTSQHTANNQNDPIYQQLLEKLLGSVYVVATTNDALAARAALTKDAYTSALAVPTFLTQQDTILYPDGRLVVGAAAQNGASATQGALQRKRELRELSQVLPKLQQDLARAQTCVQEKETALAALKDSQAKLKGELATLAAHLSSAQAEIGRNQQQLRQTTAELTQVEEQRKKAQERLSTARTQVDVHKAAAQKAQETLDAKTQELQRATEDRTQASRTENSLHEQLSNARLRLATITERKNHLAQKEQETAKRHKSAQTQAESLQKTAAALDVVRLRVEPLYKRYDAINQKAVEWASRLRDRASLAEADSDSLKQTIADARSAVTAAQDQLASAREQANGVDIRMGKLEVQVENAIAAISAQGAVLDEALEIPQPQDRLELERTALRLKHELDNIGPVNEVAMDQYATLKTRADYINEQVEDLEAAKKALAKITAAIERKMRQQFLVVFDQVNTNFQTIFGLLFPGGTAHLELCDPDHVDETGVEIIAQPRGKKIQKMTLMSGGEKSLTALALLFAVYRTRTVPFYVFDEVEAALDDANLSKLLDAIEELKTQTQLIVISHQRRTMEQADVLYGVSMHSDGVSHVVSQRLDKTTGKVVNS